MGPPPAACARLPLSWYNNLMKETGMRESIIWEETSDGDETFTHDGWKVVISIDGAISVWSPGDGPIRNVEVRAGGLGIETSTMYSTTRREDFIIPWQVIEAIIEARRATG
jgi:hypothetical protein